MSKLKFDKGEEKNMVRAAVRPRQFTEAGVSRGPSYIAGIIHKLLEQES